MAPLNATVSDTMAMIGQMLLKERKGYVWQEWTDLALGQIWTHNELITKLRLSIKTNRTNSNVILFESLNVCWWVGDLLKHPYLFLREQGGHLGKDFIKSSANVQKRSSPFLLTFNHILFNLHLKPLRCSKIIFFFLFKVFFYSLK